MKPVKPRILAVNEGSSSLKFALFEAGGSLDCVTTGEVGRADPGAGAWIDAIARRGGLERLAAVGHRVVHGGPRYSTHLRITREVLEELRRVGPIDPEHLPAEIALIEEIHRRFPDLPQVACFDTAFHREMPVVAKLLPIPRRFGEQGVRRYGFHGLSYEYLMAELTRLSGARAAQGRTILAHLGSGASLAAVSGGKPIDTSMGFTPASGVPMSTRSGDLDPGLVAYLARTTGLDATRFDKMVNFESGLLGVSEISPDIRELLALEKRDIRAAEAVALFCYQVKKWIGAFAAALGGLDTLVFTGGIGENSPVIRGRVCAGLEFLGVALDEARNSANQPLISATAGNVVVRAIRANEERMIAENVCRILEIPI